MFYGIMVNLTKYERLPLPRWLTRLQAWFNKIRKPK